MLEDWIFRHQGRALIPSLLMIEGGADTVIPYVSHICLIQTLTTCTERHCASTLWLIIWATLHWRQLLLTQFSHTSHLERWQLCQLCIASSNHCIDWITAPLSPKLSEWCTHCTEGSLRPRDLFPFKCVELCRSECFAHYGRFILQVPRLLKCFVSMPWRKQILLLLMADGERTQIILSVCFEPFFIAVSCSYGFPGFGFPLYFGIISILLLEQKPNIYVSFSGFKVSGASILPAGCFLRFPTGFKMYGGEYFYPLSPICEGQNLWPIEETSWFAQQPFRQKHTWAQKVSWRFSTPAPLSLSLSSLCIAQAPIHCYLVGKRLLPLTWIQLSRIVLSQVSLATRIPNVSIFNFQLCGHVRGGLNLLSTTPRINLSQIDFPPWQHGCQWGSQVPSIWSW